MTEALIGPNAIIQVADAIRREFGPDQLLRIMHAARLGHFVAEPPQHMVSEGDVVRLHRAVAASLPVEAGRALMWQAGENTARYLLANRIPRLAQTVLQVLAGRSCSPAADECHQQARLDLRRQQHVQLQHGRTGADLARWFAAVCSSSVPDSGRGLFQATFETLFRELVSPRTG
jgi:divinyl protochlorophyllide a 8-vinyl-reductase